MNNNNRTTDHILGTLLKLMLALLLIGLLFSLQSLPIVRGELEDLQTNITNKAEIEAQVSGDTVSIEPAGKVSWQEMLDYEALNPAELGTPIVVPFMPMPEPRGLSEIGVNVSSGETTTVAPSGQANLQEMADYEAIHPTVAETQRVVPFMSAPEPVELPMTTNTAISPESGFPAAPQVVPGTTASFLGLDDNNTTIPPDTMGAVGPNHVMVMLNSQVRIQSKTGSMLSTVTSSTFWTSGTGLSGSPFDPKVVYDSLSNRWMATIDADSRSASSAVWFAISDGDDPTGTWTFYAFDADSTDTNWADYPGFGINSTWIAITNNMFTNTTNAFVDPKMWVIDKSTALAGGALTLTVFDVGFDTAGGYDGFTLKPALTFDAAESTLYIVDNSGLNFGSGRFLLRISQITGTGAAPVWSAVPGSTAVADSGLFEVATANRFNFTQIDADQLGTTTDVETNDPRIINAVYRNGRLWMTHTAGLPATTTADRTAAFWYEINPTSAASPIIQSGYVDNGAGTHYLFPSIAVNANNDVALGFSYSDGTQYVEAAYTGRESADTAGTMGTVTTCKAGEDSYVKDFGSGRIRWGDYSATVIDPTDDLAFWTLQEYAETDVGGSASDDRWGTWWCRAQIGNYWQGDDATNPTLWNVAENWSSGAVPICTTDAIIPTSPLGGVFPTVNVDATVRDLTVETSATINMAGNTLNICGDWDNSGTFNSTGGTVAFIGSTTQNLNANVATAFTNLTVNSGTTLVETVAADNATVSGILTNGGTIRKSKSSLGAGSTTFGLTSASINVATLGNLSTLGVDRVGSANANEDSNGGGTNMLDTYYSLTPNINDASFDLDLCLNYTDAELVASPAVSSEASLRLCRWTGSAWNCPDRSGSSNTTNNTVCAANVANFSEWTMGEVGPTVVTLKDLGTPENTSGYSGIIPMMLLVFMGCVVMLVVGVRRLQKQEV